MYNYALSDSIWNQDYNIPEFGGLYLTSFFIHVLVASHLWPGIVLFAAYGIAGCIKEFDRYQLFRSYFQLKIIQNK